MQVALGDAESYRLDGLGQTVGEAVGDRLLLKLESPIAAIIRQLRVAVDRLGRSVVCHCFLCSLRIVR
ncbi:MAG: hypothetical protein AAFX78_14250 [Cyanobacteria bacterium J06638_20]